MPGISFVVVWVVGVCKFVETGLFELVGEISCCEAVTEELRERAAARSTTG